MAHSNKQQSGKDFATVNHLQALDICILLIAITSTIMKKVQIAGTLELLFKKAK